MTERRVLIGVIAAAHGIKGEVKVKTFTSTPERFGGYGPLLTQDGRRLEIVTLRPLRADEVIAAFGGVCDRNTAETLKGQHLYVPRAALPEPNPGEFYHADLIGLSVHDSSGKTIGTVRSIDNFGAGDLVEVEFPAGGTEFIAFTDANVPVVDVAAGYLVVELPRYAED